MRLLYLEEERNALAEKLLDAGEPAAGGGRPTMLACASLFLPALPNGFSLNRNNALPYIYPPQVRPSPCSTIA